MEETKTQMNKFEMEISLSELLTIFVKSLWIIAVCAILCGTATFIYNKNYVVPIYSAEVMFYIVPVNTLGDEYSESARIQLESQGLSYAKQIQNTYLQMLKSHTFTLKLEEDYLNAYGRTLDGDVTISGIPDTQLFKMLVTSNSRDEAYEIANQIETTAPEFMLEIIQNDSIRIVDRALMPKSPINNYTARNTLIGALLGAVLVYGVAFMVFILDRRVKGEEDLKARYNVPILGGIVDFDKKYRAYGKKKEY